LARIFFSARETPRQWRAVIDLGGRSRLAAVLAARVHRAEVQLFSALRSRSLGWRSAWPPTHSESPAPLLAGRSLGMGYYFRRRRSDFRDFKGCVSAAHPFAIVDRPAVGCDIAIRRPQPIGYSPCCAFDG
jgi:hypothetical protein